MTSAVAGVGILRFVSSRVPHTHIHREKGGGEEDRTLLKVIRLIFQEDMFPRLMLLLPLGEDTNGEEECLNGNSFFFLLL